MTINWTRLCSTGCGLLSAFALGRAYTLAAPHERQLFQAVAAATGLATGLVLGAVAYTGEQTQQQLGDKLGDTNEALLAGLAHIHESIEALRTDGSAPVSGIVHGIHERQGEGR